MGRPCSKCEAMPLVLFNAAAYRTHVPRSQTIEEAAVRDASNAGDPDMLSMSRGEAYTCAANQCYCQFRTS